MRVHGIRIVGTGSYVPEQRVLTTDLCMRTDSDVRWVERVVGCAERRVAGSKETTADLAARAVRCALDAAGLRADAVDVLIVATSTPNRPVPSTAAFVQEQIGMRASAAFDLNAVCGGFIYALTCAAGLVNSGCGKTAVVVGADVYSRITDYGHRDCVFFGDGAGAVVLSRTGAIQDWLVADVSGGGPGRLAFTVPAGGSERPATGETVNTGQHYFKMCGRQVTESACRHFPPFLKQLLVTHDLEADAIDHLVLHQASRHLLDQLTRSSGLSPDKVRSNLTNYANTAAASVPLLLDEEVRRGAIRRGERVLLGAFGAGWVWGAAVLPWAY